MGHIDAFTVWTVLLTAGEAAEHKGRHSTAQAMYKTAWATIAASKGPFHPKVATTFTYLADNYAAQGSFADAEDFYKRALTIYEKSLGPNHMNVGLILHSLSELYFDFGKIRCAEEYRERCYRILEDKLPSLLN